MDWKSVGSVDDVEAGVLAQTFGNYDAGRGLVVLEQRCHDARQSQGRAVECVAELCLFVGCAVAAFEAVSLICLEVG